MNVYSRRRCAIRTLIFLLLCTAAALGDADSLFNMSLEELMEVPIVVSAARNSQSINLSAVPVSILTREDIHFSGATSIPEVLRFVPGVDVRRLDRSRYQVSVRGLLGTFSDRTLVLINGRDAMNPVFGSIDWMHFPVLMEDIERIEVVRGPGGGVWGANAFTGVINIITTSPAALQGNLFSTTINEYGDTWNHLRLTGQKGEWSWKASVGYEDLESSDHAGAGRMESAFPALDPVIGFSTYKARDYFRSLKFDTEARYRYSEQTSFSFGAAHAQNDFGDRDTLGYFPRKAEQSDVTRLFARVDHQFDTDTHGHLQWFGNYVSSRIPHLINRYAFCQNDLEAQVDFKPAPDHLFSIGGNLRWTHITSNNRLTTNEIVFDESAYDEYGAGLFAVHQWKLTDRLTLESQARVDHFSKTTTDWSARTAFLYALDDRNEHIVRFGAARAHRSAATMVRETTLISLGGAFQTYTGPDVGNEHTYSIEAGYAGRLSDNLMLRIDGYYQRMENFLGASSTVIGPVTLSTLDNYGGADSHGVEAELTYDLKQTKLTAWYAYNELNTDDSAEVVRAYLPSRHKAGFRFLYTLNENWTFAANYAYNNIIHLNKSKSPFGEPDMFHQVDLTLSRWFAKGRGEWMIGVSDLLNEVQKPVYDVITFTSFETPGRTFFTRLQWRF
jgi:iron complex outermembrane receptor protein